MNCLFAEKFDPRPALAQVDLATLAPTARYHMGHVDRMTFLIHVLAGADATLTINSKCYSELLAGTEEDVYMQFVSSLLGDPGIDQTDGQWATTELAGGPKDGYTPGVPDPQGVITTDVPLGVNEAMIQVEFRNEAVNANTAHWWLGLELQSDVARNGSVIAIPQMKSQRLDRTASIYTGQ